MNVNIVAGAGWLGGGDAGREVGDAVGDVIEGLIEGIGRVQAQRVRHGPVDPPSPGSSSWALSQTVTTRSAPSATSSMVRGAMSGSSRPWRRAVSTAPRAMRLAG